MLQEKKEPIYNSEMVGGKPCALRAVDTVSEEGRLPYEILGLCFIKLSNPVYLSQGG